MQNREDFKDVIIKCSELSKKGYCLELFLILHKVKIYGAEIQNLRGNVVFVKLNNCFSKIMVDEKPIYWAARGDANYASILMDLYSLGYIDGKTVIKSNEDAYDYLVTKGLFPGCTDYLNDFFALK
jgi:hypothetical protein